MLIPLGILAGSGGVAGSYELIATEILGSAQSSVTFSSLGDYSSIYKHLQIRAVTKQTTTGGQNLRIQLNGDSGSNYAWHYLLGNGSSVSSSGGASANFAFAGNLPHANQTSQFGAIVLDLLDPFSTTKNKTLRALNAESSTNIWLASGLYMSTSSTTSITLFSGSGNLTAGSRFSLYGVKG
jgi:hypothetical protein